MKKYMFFMCECGKVKKTQKTKYDQRISTSQSGKLYCSRECYYRYNREENKKKISDLIKLAQRRELQ